MTPDLSDTAPAEHNGEKPVAATESKDVDTTEYVTGWKLVAVVAGVALACFLMLIDTMIISTAIPRITDDFNSLADIGWYASAYQFGSAAPQPLTGKIFTHFRTKWSFLFFFAIFEVGSVLCGAAQSSPMLIIGRTIAGLGGAGIINGAIIIISSCVPQEKRPVGQLGMVVGPLVGGAFTSYNTWRWCFYINLPIGAVVAVAVAFIHIPEQTHKAKAMAIFHKLHHYLDFVGFFLFAPAVLQLLLALQYGGNEFAWRSSQVIGLFCGSAATFVVWAFWNRRKGDDALLPHSLIGRRIVWVSGLFQALFMSALYGSVYYLPIYFQAINGVSAMLSGVYLLPTILPELVMAGVAGGLIMKIGYIIPFALVSTILLSIANGLYSMLRPGSPMGWWIGFQIIGGFGAGIGLNLAIVAVQAFVTGEELSSAMAFIVFMQSLGPAIFLVLCNLLFVASLKTQLPQHAPTANVGAVMQAGATGFRAIVEPGELPGVLTAYANSVNRTFYLVTALAAACFVVLWGMGWKDLRNPTGRKTGEAAGPEGNEKVLQQDEVETRSLPA
ncbi:efflux pump [Melanomma pulvis-pyrius CBS 109.77]|uniref:Efflux pump n=1 Tax=Melanomma pulvis-pyrius CBS 109.77 TaxID=1314802 RepID=A0A6A6X0W9_9PLEO|nr:efflux pump [Melanomma pulvis-pyrius CBS 109.77]